METSLTNPLIELEKLGNVLGSQPITFNTIFYSKASQWICRKDWGECMEIIHVATSYRSKIFRLHLFLKGKVGFCEPIFSTKKVSAFCRKLELFIRQPNHLQAKYFWLNVSILSGGWEFGASFPCSLWGTRKCHIFSVSCGWARVVTGAHMNTSAACGTEFGCELISPSTPSARPRICLQASLGHWGCSRTLGWKKAPTSG